MARKYLMDKDVAKFKATLAGGKTLAEATAAVVARDVDAAAVDDFVKNSPGLLDEASSTPAGDEPDAPKGKKGKKGG